MIRMLVSCQRLLNSLQVMVDAMESGKLVLYPHILLACTALLGMSYVQLWRLLLELFSKVSASICLVTSRHGKVVHPPFVLIWVKSSPYSGCEPLKLTACNVLVQSKMLFCANYCTHSAATCIIALTQRLRWLVRMCKAYDKGVDWDMKYTDPGMQVLDKLDFNDGVVQHVVLASIPPQEVHAAASEVLFVP